MNSETAPRTRDEYRRTPPQLYLAAGWRTADGQPIKHATGWWATAGAEQLLAGGVAIQEVETLLEAMKQLLPLYSEQIPGDMRNFIEEALGLTADLLRQPNNPALVNWLVACTQTVRYQEDLPVFLSHLRAVLLQCATIAKGIW